MLATKVGPVVALAAEVVPTALVESRVIAVVISSHELINCNFLAFSSKFISTMCFVWYLLIAVTNTFADSGRLARESMLVISESRDSVSTFSLLRLTSCWEKAEQLSCLLLVLPSRSL